jgi:hypothetical protein
MLIGLMLNCSPNLQNSGSTPLQFASQVSTALALENASQQHYHLGCTELSMLKHRSAIEIVGFPTLTASINIQATALRASKEISLVSGRLATGVVQSVWMKMLFDPLLALLFVE